MSHKDLELGSRKQALKAIEEGDIPALELFLEHGGDLSGGGVGADSLLVRAMGAEQWSVLEWLINQGAPLNQVDNDGWAELHFAITHPIPIHCIQALIQKGSDVNHVDKYGMGLLEICIEAYDNNQTLYEPLFEMLLKAGAHPEVRRFEDGWSLLHRAVVENERVRGIIELIVEYGHPVDACERDSKKTALHIAAHLNRLEAVQTLIGLGASTEAVDSDGKTPLELAKNSATTFGGDSFKYLEGMMHAQKEASILKAATAKYKFTDKSKRTTAPESEKEGLNQKSEEDQEPRAFTVKKGLRI